MKAFLIVLGILALLTLALGLYIFHFIFYKPKRSKKIPKYYIGTPHYKVSRAGMVIMDHLPVEDVYIQSRDGLRLHAYLYPAPGNKNDRFVLGIHGFRSYARPEFAPYLAFYHSLGYSLLLPDDRAHGPSEGTYIGFGVLDRLDCVDWAKYLVNRFGPDTKILLHGVSMGAATVLSASGEEDLPAQVQGTVADCGYTSGWDILSYELRHAAHLPLWPFLPMCEFLLQKKAGYSLKSPTPLQQAEHAKVPILVVHGAKDNMVPAAMAREIYDHISSRKNLLIVGNAGHGESIAMAPQEYHEAIRTFFSI